MYKVQVMVYGETQWVGNGLEFKTIQEAKDYAIDLMTRWTLVEHWRVTDLDGKPLDQLV